jgi:predicted transcriptional regulator
LNLGIEANPHCIKVNAHLIKEQIKELQTLLKEFKDVFAWTYKDLKGIPPKLVQRIIELDTSIPPTHQARYRLNPNYATTIKQNIDKLLAIGIIQPLEEATWLSPIMVLLKKNGKLRICIDFRKLNKATKKILILYHFLMKY